MEEQILGQHRDNGMDEDNAKLTATITYLNSFTRRTAEEIMR